MSANNNCTPSPSTSSSCKPNTSNSKKSAQLDDRTRLKRNAGEKKRRDKLNNYISELSAMVPSCRMPQSQRKLDKSTILKLTVSYMKLHAEMYPESVDESAMSWKPSFLSNEELGQLMLEALDGFLFVIWSTGRTIYVSESITPLLGHLQQELVGKNFLELVHPEDIPMVRDRMFPHQSESGYIEELSTPSPEPISSPSSTISDSPSFLRRNFVMRMCRGGFASAQTEYEMVSCSGHLRRWNEVTRNSPVETADMLPLDGYCLVGVGRLQCSQAIREMTPSGPSLNAWTSHHSLDAKYIHIDQNASPILGYTAAELLGSNGYNFYHDEDLNGLARSHVDLTKSGTGDTSLYRFLTKGQQWLWIKTRGVVKYQEGTKHPTSVICHNIVASYAEVWQYLQNKSRQYGPKERQLGPAPPPDVARTVAASTKTEQTSPGGDIKVEQYSPQSVPSQDRTYSMYFTPAETPSPQKPVASEVMLTPSPGTSVAHHSPYYNSPAGPSPPNFVAFSTTEYVQPSTSGGSSGGNFTDLFPNYRPSISTEEVHGKYKVPNQINNQQTVPAAQPDCNYRKYSPEEVKPVYMQPRQASFLETMASPTTPSESNSARPSSVLLNTPSPNHPSTYQSLHKPSATSHDTPNVLVTTPAKVVVMGQPGYTGSYMVQPRNHQQVPNVTVRSVALKSEEPVVGMPVASGFPKNVPVTTAGFVQQQPVTTAAYNQQQPVTTGAYVQQQPVTTAAYNQQQPVTTAAYVQQQPVTTAAYVQQQPVTTAAYVQQQPVTTAAYVQQQPVTTAAYIQHQSATTAAAYPQQQPVKTAAYNQQQAVTTAAYPQQQPVTTTAYNQHQLVTTAAAYVQQQPVTTAAAYPQQRPVTTAAYPQQQPVTTAAYPQQHPVTTAAYPQQHPVTTTAYNQHQLVTTAAAYTQQLPITTNGSNQMKKVPSSIPHHLNSQYPGAVKQLQQQEHMFAKKGVSVYSSGAEKRCASPANLNSCAQVSMKRMRNESPGRQPSVPTYVKPAASPVIPHYNGQYTTPFISPQTNGYHHHPQPSGDVKNNNHVIANNHLIERQDVHNASLYHSIDTGQHKQT